jgi:hypothetical protein
MKKEAPMKAPKGKARAAGRSLSKRSDAPPKVSRTSAVPDDIRRNTYTQGRKAGLHTRILGQRD